MPRETRPQKQKIEKVMHEFKHGELAQKGGRKITDHKQAVAVALSEAGVSRTKKAAPAKTRISGTNRPPSAGATSQTRAELYREATRRGIAGRSRMTKQELAKALRR